MHKLWLIASLLVSATQSQAQTPPKPVHEYTPSRPYVYVRSNWDQMVAATEGDDEQKRAVLALRWLEVTFAIGQINASHVPSFPHTLEYLSTGKLRSTSPMVRVMNDMTEDTEYPIRAMVMVWGDVDQELVMPDGADLVHIWGELNGTLRVKGDCEVIIAGDVARDAIIETDGPTSVFIGGDLLGILRNTDATSIWINGDHKGELTTGSSTTQLHIMGDYLGSVTPEKQAETLYLDVRGTMHSDYMRAVASHVYKQLFATVGISDIAAAFHPRTYNPNIGKWVVHFQNPDLPKPASNAPETTPEEDAAAPADGDGG